MDTVQSARGKLTCPNIGTPHSILSASGAIQPLDPNRLLLLLKGAGSTAHYRTPPGVRGAGGRGILPALARDTFREHFFEIYYGFWQFLNNDRMVRVIIIRMTEI